VEDGFVTVGCCREDGIEQFLDGVVGELSGADDVFLEFAGKLKGEWGVRKL
jgi:hypothetical protein